MSRSFMMKCMTLAFSKLSTDGYFYFYNGTHCWIAIRTKLAQCRAASSSHGCQKNNDE